MYIRPVSSGEAHQNNPMELPQSMAGRGIAPALRQARELAVLIDRRRLSVTGIGAVTTRFDAWCTENIQPWFEDQRYADAHRLRRRAGRTLTCPHR
jgi:hypothetical protein